MRLHHLEITAFGPFIGPVEVDFDALSEAGLFLLAGPTGAGKTSVLDAVCFALYGEVPGDRGAGKRLRSDLAADGVAPVVRLETTLAGRRFRITRSPAWTRPKKRGVGTTPEQARVVVEEIEDGHPAVLTTRLDEAGQLIGDLLGMNASQFTQVVMLPQGRFQDFLRATSEDRHRLLQKLFRTQRFDDIERWLRERRTALGRTTAAHAAEVRGVLHRLAEVCPADVDDDLVQADHLDRLADDGVLAALADKATATTAVETADAHAALTDAGRAAERAQKKLAEGLRCAELQARHAEARLRLDALAGDAPEITRLRDAVARAHRARPVAAVGVAWMRARTRRDEAGRDREVAWEALDGAVDRPVATETELDEALDRAREALAAVNALREVDTEVAGLRLQQVDLATQIAATESSIATINATAAALPARLLEAEQVHDTARQAAAALGAAAERRQQTQTRLATVLELGRLRDDLAEARDLLSGAVEVHQGLRERILDLQERRLAGMAAEIAGGLVVGGSCPVCGSCEHPQPARSGPDAPTADQVRELQSDLADSEIERQAREGRVRELTGRAAVLAEQVGSLTADRARIDADEAADELARLTTLAEGLDAATAHLDELRAAVRESEEQLGAARERLSGLTASRTALDERLGGLTQTLAAALDGHRDLASLTTARERAVVALERAHSALAEESRAAVALADAAADLDRVLADCGFDDLSAATAADLPDHRVAAHETLIAAHDAAAAAARGVLDDAAVLAAADAPAPDLPELRNADENATRQHAEAVSRHRQAQRAHDRVQRLVSDLTGALDRWEPVRRDHDVARRVAGLVDGTAPDNRLQMKLAAYVLSRRLTQVVAAANERLDRMTARRFTLEHTAERGAGERRGGLSLRVVDAWSGEARDPVTLSGGETFVVSLALALGLTDVVTQESGGPAIGTLFVDEGFGSLDADTLDDVMDTLDALREGGRVVGVVSHVSELATRIPTQLQVTKARHGSSVVLAHAGA